MGGLNSNYRFEFAARHQNETIKTNKSSPTSNTYTLPNPMLALFKSIAPLRVGSTAIAKLHVSSVVLKEAKPTTKKATKPAKEDKAATKKPAVKKAVPPFFLYVKQRYALDKDSIMQHDFSKRTVVLREEWERLTDAEKAPFLSAAATDKERYVTELEKAKKDAPPKRPMSSYLLWLDGHREALKNANPDATFTELGAIAGAEWKGLKTTEKEHYQKTSAEALIKWKGDLAKWKESRP